MQYHLDTIPVWEAMEWKRECPLCGLQHKTELEEAERTLGASVMEPSERIKVNQKGICVVHHQMLFGMQNRLGHALLMDSHGKEQLSRITQLQKTLRNSSGRRRAWFAKRKGQASLIGALQTMDMECVICERIAQHMARYRYTFLHLWKNDAAFRDAWAASKGVCLPHLRQLLTTAQQQLSAKDQEAFAAEGLAHLVDALTLDSQDLEWFTRKFDYRNQDQPWGNSKNALERTVNRLRGYAIGEAPCPPKR